MKSTKNKESSEQEKIIDPHGPPTINNSTRSNNFGVIENNNKSNFHDSQRNLEENKGHPIKENNNNANNNNNIFFEEEEKKEIKKNVESKKPSENNNNNLK